MRIWVGSALRCAAGAGAAVPVDADVATSADAAKAAAVRTRVAARCTGGAPGLGDGDRLGKTYPLRGNSHDSPTGGTGSRLGHDAPQRPRSHRRDLARPEGSPRWRQTSGRGWGPASAPAGRARAPRAARARRTAGTPRARPAAAPAPGW